MPRGRPVYSPIRQNIQSILFYLGKGYGYQIAKIYNSCFTPCTREVIYYHLRKGTQLGEFHVEKIAQEKGEYSWGNVVEKIYYVLGDKANPEPNEKIKALIEGKGG